MNIEKTYSTHNYNGIWMLVGLVALLALPLAIGYMSQPRTPMASLQADASLAH